MTCSPDWYYLIADCAIKCPSSNGSGTSSQSSRVVLGLIERGHQMVPVCVVRSLLSLISLVSAGFSRGSCPLESGRLRSQLECCLGETNRRVNP
ncbi:hypothetical protein WOLCODRAFT_139100 [Wolfiporia cocos MD-104 SS10]|uniref:Uncharacterized protein n=1 Tax=Wolfiporia cocos (strain MD-104) TaxID=742152 RepID=A0A2H3JXB3_WOLCO|nr:hypothetical protein WOLCODRAFT_139100 [Wolfiporia cocos MD-104 SS10]